MRTCKPRCSQVPGVEYPTLGDYIVVDVGVGVVSQGYRTTFESGKHVLEEMEVQVVVEKHRENDEKDYRVVPKGYESESVKQKAVRVNGRRLLEAYRLIHVLVVWKIR